MSLYKADLTFALQASFAEPASSSPAFILVNLILDALGIPARLQDTSVGSMTGASY